MAFFTGNRIFIMMIIMSFISLRLYFNVVSETSITRKLHNLYDVLFLLTLLQIK